MNSKNFALKEIDVYQSYFYNKIANYYCNLSRKQYDDQNKQYEKDYNVFLEEDIITVSTYNEKTTFAFNNKNILSFYHISVNDGIVIINCGTLSKKYDKFNLLLKYYDNSLDINAAQALIKHDRAFVVAFEKEPAYEETISVNGARQMFNFFKETNKDYEIDNYTRGRK